MTSGARAPPQLSKALSGTPQLNKPLPGMPQLNGTPQLGKIMSESCQTGKVTSFPPESDGEKVENIGKVPSRHGRPSSDQVTPWRGPLGRVQFGKKPSIVETENKTKDSVQAEAEKEPVTKKRRVSPYYWFFEEQRVSLKKENPEMTNMMAHKILREVWDKMLDSNKEGEEPLGNTLHRQIEA